MKILISDWSGGADQNGDKDSEGEDPSFQPENCMKLQLEVLEGELTKYKFLEMKNQCDLSRGSPLVMIIQENFY